MSKIFKIPAYSQFLDVEDKKWKSRACGIVALKIVLEYWGVKEKADDLIKLGLKQDAYIPGIGWKHGGLVSIAKEFGLRGENLDWFKDLPEEAFEKLLSKLEKYPVLASIYKNFKLGGSGHLIVLTGYENGWIFFNDPDSKTRKGIQNKVVVEKFLNGWKRRIVVIHS